MTSAEPLGPPPGRSTRDHIQKAAAVTASAIPGVGGPLAMLIDGVLQPSHDRRLQAWLSQLGGMTQQLIDDGIEVAALSENEEFVSAVSRATVYAMGTHIEAKVRLLAAALAGFARTSDRDILALAFLDLVGRLEPEHIAALALLPGRPTLSDADVVVFEDDIDSFGVIKRRAEVPRAALLVDLRANGLAGFTETGANQGHTAFVQTYRTALGDRFLGWLDAMNSLENCVKNGDQAGESREV